MDDFSIAEQLRWLETLPFTPLRRALPPPTVADVAGTVRGEISRLMAEGQLPRGARVAVAVGSRGIGQLFTIVKTSIDTLVSLGFQPFVVAAMGSHGGATEQGQRTLLAGYGISAERLGVPVRCEMEAVLLGENRLGDPVWWDANALAADAVLPISRVKAHTDYVGEFESGIAKMLVIGLGKRQGAQTHHQYGVRGLREVMPTSLSVILEKTGFLGGLAIVENSDGQPALIEAVAKPDLLRREPELLQMAKQLAGKLPFSTLDLLVVGECGKNYSGTGMDVHVLGRHLVEGEPEPWQPRITRLCVLALSPESDGNAVGAGLADLTTHRLLEQSDEQKTRMNYLTSCFLLRSKVPLAFPTDQECIATGLRTCWQPKAEAVRAALIPNTLELSRLWVSPALAGLAPGWVVDGEAAPLPFAADGSLPLARLFPASWAGRRLATSGPASGPAA